MYYSFCPVAAAVVLFIKPAGTTQLGKTE